MPAEEKIRQRRSRELERNSWFRAGETVQRRYELASTLAFLREAGEDALEKLATNQVQVPEAKVEQLKLTVELARQRYLALEEQVKEDPNALILDFSSLSLS